MSAKGLLGRVLATRVGIFIARACGGNIQVGLGPRDLRRIGMLVAVQRRRGIKSGNLPRKEASKLSLVPGRSRLSLRRPCKRATRHIGRDACIYPQASRAG